VEARVSAGTDRALIAGEPRLKLLTGARLDGRLVAAFAALHAPGAAAADAAAPLSGAAMDAVHAAVCARCEALLGQMSVDAAAPPPGLDADAPVLLALAHKRRVLREALAALRPAAAAAV
jgi:hypothetical protein